MKRIIIVLIIGITYTGILAQTLKKAPVHVFITAGQSNTDGRVNNKLLPAYIKALSEDTVNFEQGNYHFCKISQNDHSGIFTPYWPKGRITNGVWTYDAVLYYQLEQAIKNDFYVIKYAVGGTSIQYPNDTTSGRYWSANPAWIRNAKSYENNGSSLLRSFTESIDAAIDKTLSKIESGYKIDAFIWHQGESDDIYASKYYSNLKTVVEYVRKHLTEKTGVDYSELPFVFGSIPKSNRHFKPEIDNAMRRIANEDANAYLIDMSEGTLQRDRTHFDEKSAEYLGNEMYKVLDEIYGLSSSCFRIAKFKADKQCAVSYTFDDGLLEHATLVAPKFEKLGFRATFWVNGNTIDKNDSTKPRMSWQQLKKMEENGHEISNHGWSHKNMNRLNLAEAKVEIEKNDSAIFVHTGCRPITFCYPFNAKNDSVIALASEHRVGTRIRQFSVGGKTTSDNLSKRLNELIKNNEWGVTMTHGITYGYDHFSSADIFWQHLQEVKKIENLVWVAPFWEVAAYMKEKKEITCKINEIKNGLIVTPNLMLDGSLFSMPLTAVVERTGVKKIKVIQNKKTLKTQIFNDKVLFDFNPYGGPIEIKF